MVNIMENNVLKTQKLLKPKHNTESEFLMKTNNVDFGKSFKFICPEDDTVFTYQKGCEDMCRVSWRDSEGDYEERSYSVHLVRSYITSGDWIVIPTDMKEIVGDVGNNTDYTRECIDKLSAWTGCMSYNDSYFGEPAGMLKSTIRQLDKTYKECNSHSMKEIVGDIGPELSFQTNTKITDTLLNEIKSFTTTSKHSVNIYKGAYEVFRSGEDVAYQCKDDETLKNVMQALGVLDSVLVGEVGV